MKEAENDKIRILIVGAGKAGELIASDIANDKDSAFKVTAFIDDDIKKLGTKVAGIKVIGLLSDLRNVVKENSVEEVFIAIPSERGKVIRNIIEATEGLNVVYKILPRMSEVLMQSYATDFMKHIRKVRVEDLLGGEILKTDQEEITQVAKKQTILITGAAGSIGSELSRQLSAHGTKKIIFYDWWENGMFDLRNQLLDSYKDIDSEFIIGDIKDVSKINQVIKTYKPDTVFHAAAYKHVPLMEGNPAEAIRNNIIGTKIVAEAAIKNNVNKFVLVSSDKAVNPTNIMGATKRAAEKIVHILSKSQSSTIFCAVRFGNVVNSNGSAIPIFERQIEMGGPVTVTHKNVTRYFMTIPEAVHLILKSWVIGENNDLFVLDMGEPVKIYDLVRLLIILQGYEPVKDIRINIIGLRPGEKLFEEVLLREEEVKATSVKKIYRTKNYHNFDGLSFLNNLNLLIETIEEDGLNVVNLRTGLETLVSTYKPSSNDNIN